MGKQSQVKEARDLMGLKAESANGMPENVTEVKTTFVGACEAHRESIELVAKYVKNMAEGLKNSKEDGIVPEDKSEMIANLILSYRHLEDAKMRLGKAIQAKNGGVSIYDKNTTIGIDKGMDQGSKTVVSSS